MVTPNEDRGFAQFTIPAGSIGKDILPIPYISEYVYYLS